MTTPVGYEEFSGDLLPGEKVQWTGRPNPSVVFHPEDAYLIPFSLMWGGFAIFWLLEATGGFGQDHANKNFEWFGLVWGTPFVVVGQYLIWGRFLYQGWMKRRTAYLLTDRRALIVSNGIRGHSCSAVSLAGLVIIGKRVRADGNGCVSLGGPYQPTMQWARGRNKAPSPPAFEDVDDANSIYQLVHRLQARASRAPEELP